MAILNVLLGVCLAYIVTFGLKDREAPTVSIKFPTNGYEFRSFKKISLSANDNKGIKSITYKIDGEIYHVENSENPISAVWDPCSLDPGRHILQVDVSDFAKHITTSDAITFYISPSLGEDCNGNCGGKAKIDDCGVCSGGESNHVFNSDRDCTDTCFGGAYTDDCEVCSGGKTGIPINNDKDCLGVCFGDAISDDCGVCFDSLSKHIENSDKDCNADCFGDAITDDCEVCSGGKTGIPINNDKDCLGVCFGEAYLDECNVCSGGETNHEENSDKDCIGECFGKAIIDGCNVCAGGNTGLVVDADMDCERVCFGEAYLDECKVCSEGTTNHKKNSDKDCNGDCFGEAFIDECLICSEGNTNHGANIDMDCNGDCSETSSLWDGGLGGTAFLDDCNICSEGNANHTANSDKDCNGDCFGDAIIDPCGGCTGGQTGVGLNQSPVKFSNKSYTCGDLMFVMEMYKLKYPKNTCASFNVLSNKAQLDNCISQYLKLGETRWSVNGRLTQYILSDDNIIGVFPERAQFATKLNYLDISQNEFWGSIPQSFCDIHRNGTIRLSGNTFCPPYPECLNDNPVLKMDLLDMESVARCK